MYSIKNNMPAKNAQRQLNINTKEKSKNSEKLSSGYRINRSADDAASLSISEKMRRQIRGLDQGVTNSKEGVSLCQVADSALSEVNEMLNRITELTIKSANGTSSMAERAAIQAEISQLTTEITRIGKTTKFNEIAIFDLAGTPREVTVSSELIRSPSAGNGYMSEAYQRGSNFYMAATMDFSTIDSSNVRQLHDKTFSFSCTANCSEVFEFTFINGGGNDHKEEAGPKHKYWIDIQGKSSGSEILNALYNYVHKYEPHPVNSANGYVPNRDTNNDTKVGHANVLTKIDNNTLVIWGSEDPRNSAEDAIAYAEQHYKDTHMGKTDFAEVIGYAETRIVNILDIQFGAEKGESLELEIDRMNSEILHIDDLDVTTVEGCDDALGDTKYAMEFISSMRAKIGAQQNRLEADIASEDNTVENTTAAESRVRDMDMAKGMVAYSLGSILEQSGQSMLAQINKSRQDIVSLLE